MKKNKKTLSIIAAALLAVSPVAAGVISLPNISTVKADTQLSSDQLMASYYENARAVANEYGDNTLIKLTKKNPVLNVYAGETPRQIKKNRITDVSANIGRVTSLNGVYIYKTFDNGLPDYGTKLKASDELHQGVNYVAILDFNYSIPDNSRYIYISYRDYEDDPLVADEYDSDETAALLVPVNVSAAKPETATSTKKAQIKKAPKTARKASTKRAYVKVRRGHKVRTYTSRGRFSKHYVYGHHTYKVTSKKHIKRHGYCWKLSGKNQYVPAKYVRVR